MKMGRRGNIWGWCDRRRRRRGQIGGIGIGRRGRRIKRKVKRGGWVRNGKRNWAVRLGRRMERRD
jgi:hypothetical protein